MQEYSSRHPSADPFAQRKGRGARTNPTGRFERFRVEDDLEALAGAAAAARAAETLAGPSTSPTLRAPR
jgi:hypothetical protein